LAAGEWAEVGVVDQVQAEGTRDQEVLAALAQAPVAEACGGPEAVGLVLVENQEVAAVAPEAIRVQQEAPGTEEPEGVAEGREPAFRVNG